MKWNCLELRITSFNVNKEGKLNKNIWQNITGETPDIQQFRPKIGIVHEEGIFNDNKLFVDADPLRLNVLFSASYKNTPELESIETIGEFNKQIDTVHNIYKALKKESLIPPSKRVALGVVLLKEVASKQEGFETLKSLLSGTVNIDPENTSDFIYQINKLESITVDGNEIAVNCLRKWTVSKYSFFPAGVDPSSSPGIGDLFAVRLDLDINTLAKFQGSIPIENEESIFEQLIEVSKRVSNE